jgi:Vitamin K-dependent gamma-carboxylase
MQIVGTVPWLPRPLKRWTWLTAPIPAERLAAWRIGTGLILLLDALLFYAPVIDQLYGPASLAEPGVFADRFAPPHWNWSVLRWLPVDWGGNVCMGVWITAAGLLICGWHSRLMALLLWALSISFFNTNPYIHNTGDRIRNFLLLLLIFAPTDAACALRRRPDQNTGPVHVSGWPARLMLIQMAIMYFMNGFYKLQGKMWWEGSVMHYVAHDLAWARWSALPLPYWVSQCLTWGALIWEVGFPLWIMLKRTRVPALIIGVIFHVITFFHLEIAAFPLYALCLYLPLAPWERLRRPNPVQPARAPEKTKRTKK